jgi:flavodoxin
MGVHKNFRNFSQIYHILLICWFAGESIMKKFVLLLLVFFCATSAMELWAQNQGGGGKILAAYFSHTGNTRELARQIQQKTGADIFEIIPVTAYSRDNDEAHTEARRDRDSQVRPPLKTHVENMAQYDTIFLGFPVWLGSIPAPVATFLEEYNFSGKRIIPFRSYGNHDSGQSDPAIKALCPPFNIIGCVFGTKGTCQIIVERNLHLAPQNRNR